MKGFTLVELLVTMCIIFVLTSLIATATGQAKKAGQRAACLNDARVLTMMVEEGNPIIFGNTKDTRFITKMRNYDTSVVVVNCYSCHPYIIDFYRKEGI